MNRRSIVSLRQRLVGRVADRLRPWLCWYDFQIIEWRKDDAPLRAPAGQLRCLTEYSEEAMLVLRDVQRDLTEERARRRFGRGLCLYALEDQGRVLATTWIIRNGERFIDELGIGLAASGNKVWLRDVYVNPNHRGRGHFGQLLNAIRVASGDQIESFSSVISTDDEPSLRAHLKFGFRRLASYTILELSRLFVFRLRWPLRPRPCSVLAPSRRFLVNGPRYRTFIAERMS